MVDRDCLSEFSSEGRVRMTYVATLPYVVVYRFKDTKSLDEIQLTKFESVLEYLTGTAIYELEGSYGIQNIEFVDDEYTVQATRDGHAQNDWLIYLNFTPRVTYAVTEFNLPDGFGPIPDDEEIELSEITLGVYIDKDVPGEPPNNLDSLINITELS
jgi:hypothetical protein